MHKFHKSLEKGKVGESLFLDYYKDRIKQLDGLRNDFQFVGSGDYVELKSDYYDMNRTENFFMERWSDVERHKAGGPWQAATNGNTWYYYLFVKNGVMFQFQTLPLLCALKKLEKEYKLIDIPNSRWLTQGYKIPRNRLKELYKQINISNEIICQ